MALSGAFSVNLNNGQAPVQGGQSQSILHVINQPLIIAVHLTNNGDTPATLAFLQSNPPQVSAPFANFFPAWSIISNQLMGNINPALFMPGQTLSAGVEIQRPSQVGQTLVIQLSAHMQGVPPLSQSWASSIYLTVTGLAVGGGGNQNPPPPTEEPGLQVSPLGIALVAVGGAAILIALNGTKD